MMSYEYFNNYIIYVENLLLHAISCCFVYAFFY
jgi:hypothetical protein